MSLNVSRVVRWLSLFSLLIVIYTLHIVFTRSTETNIFVTTNSSPDPLSVFVGQVNITYAAVVLSLSKQTSHISEFHLLYESWRFIQNFSPLSEQIIVDLIVFCEQPSCYQLPSSCIPLSYKKKIDRIAKCFYEELSPEIIKEWESYLYMTSIAFMLTKQYKQVIIKYQWILRVDQDALLTPALLFGLMNKHPTKLYNMQFGAVGHGIDFTYKRLKEIAKKLGYNHVDIHNLCSTWLVHPQDSIQIATLTTRIGKHFLEKEFGPNVPGVDNLSVIGEWPKWWRGVTSLYAAEIAINHIYSSSLGHEHESNALDHPSHSKKSVWDSWHIHCLHNEEDFSKFKYRDQLKVFLHESQTKRISKMSNINLTQTILKEILNEFRIIQNNNGTITGKITVRDYVTALAWQKAYSATGAMNFE